MASAPADPRIPLPRRRRNRYQGVFFDEFATESAWIKERAILHFPPSARFRKITLRGIFLPHPDVTGIETPLPTLDVSFNGNPVRTIAPTGAGPWQLDLDADPQPDRESTLTLTLRGVGWTNFLGWLGRVAAGMGWTRGLQRFRKQNRNRQLRLLSVELDGEVVYDFTNRHSPYSTAFARKHAFIGLNVVGFFTADLGVGESARCMLRAAQAAAIPTAAVPLRLHCKARLGDETYRTQLQDSNPYPVNVFHLDAPAGADIDARHGPQFRAGRHNIGYWAWELPEFPDAWLSYFDFFQEIWCPSDFVRTAVAAKSPVPVFTMPHAISFSRPTASAADLRRKFGLPPDQYLFLFLYDLNSYSERKNPRAAIEAFRRSGLAGSDASLVIKVHGQAGNEKDLTALQAATADLPGTILLAQSLSRQEIYELEAACDVFVSLHRSEGFGFAPAECMYLGKPVIATGWSATAEYLFPSNGCPVRYRLIELDRNHGPYAKGQTWADPDLDHAAEWMTQLSRDRDLASRLGAAGRETMETRFSPQAIGARYRDRLNAIASW